ncbi:hypothetical protein BpHYR1_054120 [Brachionus plicatilis]|uniref:Uncharacterized protein n=1 Tax=Brachionus plicatilis TaxID=10195 RepID=A0A3M7SMM0_BRAPC|nr:hypothetical protein BpHYR1_054120 [Brachionus plicatilis]
MVYVNISKQSPHIFIYHKMRRFLKECQKLLVILFIVPGEKMSRLFAILGNTFESMLSHRKRDYNLILESDEEE